jgi:hypothetical protein
MGTYIMTVNDNVNTVLLAFEHAARLDCEGNAETRLWHFLHAVLEWCDAQSPRIDFDLILEDVRASYKETA